jgi:hypothetical protein
MLGGGSLKAQPLGLQLICFLKANRYLSQINLFLFYKLSHVTQYILKSCLNKEMLVISAINIFAYIE